MYLRIAVTGEDMESHQQQGIFHAAWDLLDSGTLSDAEAQDLRSLLDWFDQKMPCPSASECKALSRRAVFWFRSGGGDYLKKAWELVQLMRLHGLLVDVFRTRNPGIILFLDHCQIAAIPIKGTF
ncbi:MAG: hypothetical protein H7Z41_10435 [Cytophagales bacterium]|nr:hypothetical protein [Armatimonadota bacterium]